MQQETPQTQPTPQEPQPSPTPPPQGNQGGDFYQPAEQAPYQATAAEQSLPSPTPHDIPQTLTWEASEYVHTEKGGLWIAVLVIITLLFAGVAFYLQAWTFLALVIIMGIAMGVFAFRPPHILQYTLDDQGVKIGNKVYNYKDFRAFGILEDGAFFTMELIPIKRFSPAISVYFSEEQGEDIVDIVGQHLSMEHIQPDIIDHVMRRLRF